MFQRAAAQCRRTRAGKNFACAHGSRRNGGPASPCGRNIVYDVRRKKCYGDSRTCHPGYGL
jgi:hypothetical protein